MLIYFSADSHSHPFLHREAYNQKMLNRGYAWIFLDSTGDLEFVYEQSMPPGYPLYLRGLLVIRPVSEEGAMFRWSCIQFNC